MRFWLRLDWTEVARDGQTTLVASLITTHGRATPLLWHTPDKTELKGSRSAIEDALLARLREVIPSDVRVTVLADRGFVDRKLLGPASGRTPMLKSTAVTEHEQPDGVFVCVKKARMKEPWCLVTSEGARTGAQGGNLYAGRFTIEESFRDAHQEPGAPRPAPARGGARHGAAPVAGGGWRSHRHRQVLEGEHVEEAPALVVQAGGQGLQRPPEHAAAVR